jgi:hypothetical protein
VVFRFTTAQAGGARHRELIGVGGKLKNPAKSEEGTAKNFLKEKGIRLHL